MGYITIAKIGVELPIYHGTSDSVILDLMLNKHLPETE